MILAVCNEKGGTGKTATTFHLARAAVLSGKTVLAIDLDPQGNLTHALSADEVPEDAAGVADALSARASERLADVIVEGRWPGADLAPTVGETLGLVRDELVVAGAGREGRLAEAIGQVKARYDLVLIDCAPSLDQLMINALTAADSALVVAEADNFSSNGLDKMLKTFQTVQRYYNPHLRVAGVVVNRYADSIEGRSALETITEALNTRELKLFNPVMRSAVVVRDAMQAGYGLDQWPGAKATVLGQIFGAYLEEALQ